ncbi:MAG TPA: hypothetical protein VH560_15025 [Polyangia bacterium]|jgi:hypothetical protein|nr:hypothetical protein [Polyangia bacterium]
MNARGGRAALVALALCVAAPTHADEPAFGSLDPFRPPAPKAAALNAAAKIPYRLGKWDEARAQYRAAEAADPDFLAPRLNVACSFVRQERFAEATAEVVALLDRAYVPWAREIIDATDLGALRVRPEMKEIERAMAAAAAKWGAGLADSLLFIARQQAPLRVPDGPGVFLLNPRQEIWAYSARTRRYQQVTAEDGHVVAMAASPDGTRLTYVTADKLVRGATPHDVALRGVAVRVLTLASMSLTPRAPIADDVRGLAIYASGIIAIGDRRHAELFRVTPAGALAPTSATARLGPPLVELQGRGVGPVHERRFGDDSVARTGLLDGGTSTISAGPVGGKLAPLKASAGAGLNGLPIP